MPRPLIDQADACIDSPLPTKCENVAECKLGCCVDPIEGTCSPNSPKSKCLELEGNWEDEEGCAISECQKGCCVLGGETKFATEKTCERYSLLYGYDFDFRNINSEIECLLLSSNVTQGACVFNNNMCLFETEAECVSQSGIFSKDSLCSNPELNTSCEKQTSIGCLEGKDEIYWFDSCGNQENIYSSDKDFSWNNGKVLGKYQSCSPDSSNSNSLDCGNCNIALGSKCSNSSNQNVKDGDFICQDLSCVDEKGNTRKNGESWCVYDSFIGDGKDTVGSRHWKRMCIDGQVKVEPCADYRGQICVQSNLKNEEGKTFSTASCVINEANACLSYNQMKTKGMQNACNKNTQCQIKKIEISEGSIYKRWRAVSRGQAHGIAKKTSHITVVLEGEKKGQPEATEKKVLKKKEKKQKSKKEGVKNGTKG